jgi:mRNA interferase MazF
VKRGDLITVVLQGDYGKPRPALVIQSDQVTGTASVTVLLLTSTLHDAPLVRHTVAPSPTNGLRAVSQVQIDRTMSVPRAKAGPVIGRLDDEDIATVSRLLAVFLGIV